MKFSPLSIKKQEFSNAFRGYDKEEVQAYLERLADEFERLQSESEKLNDEVEELKPQLAEYKRIEKNLQDTLLKAQESSSKSIESSKKQTSLLIKEAELKASQIVEKARESANEIRSSVIALREERDLVIARLKAIVSSQAQILELKFNDEDSDTLKVTEKKQSQIKNIEVNVDDIVNKLL
jgi:cell division initiation protein